MINYLYDDLKKTVLDLLPIRSVLNLAQTNKDWYQFIHRHNSMRISSTKYQRSKAYIYDHYVIFDDIFSEQINDLYIKSEYNFSRVAQVGDIFRVIISDNLYMISIHIFDGINWIAQRTFLNGNSDDPIISAEFPFPRFPLQYFSDVAKDIIRVNCLPKSEIVANIVRQDQSSFRSYFVIDQCRYDVIVKSYTIDQQNSSLFGNKLVDLFTRAIDITSFEHYWSYQTKLVYITQRMRLNSTTRYKALDPEDNYGDTQTYLEQYPCIIDKWRVDNIQDPSCDPYTTLLITVDEIDVIRGIFIESVRA